MDSMITEFSVSMEVENDNDTKWWFSAVYGPCKPRDKQDFCDELAGLRVICGERCCVRGDFNMVRSLSEKMNSIFLTCSMICFDSLIRELELCDPPILNAKFTWSNL